jgi:hypothetical protein
MFLSPVVRRKSSAQQQLRDYLKAQGVKSVAMEATGIYWLCPYEVLEKGGFQVVVVNGKYVKNLPGRKTDMKDCQWQATLHAHGLLIARSVGRAVDKALGGFYRRLKGRRGGLVANLALARKLAELFWRSWSTARLNAEESPGPIASTFLAASVLAALTAAGRQPHPCGEVLFRMASIIFRPLIAVRSLRTSWILRFIRSKAFCMCCSWLAAMRRENTGMRKCLEIKGCIRRVMKSAPGVSAPRSRSQTSVYHWANPTPAAEKSGSSKTKVLSPWN